MFWKDTGGAVTLEELERQARHEPNIRGQAIFGDPLRTKPVRVLVNISAEGLSLWETGKHISHRWADRTPPPVHPLKRAAMRRPQPPKPVQPRGVSRAR